MKILLAVDGSPCSDIAVDEVARRPWPEGSEVRILSAFELALPPTPESWALPASYLNEIDDAARKLAEAITQRTIGKLKPRLPAAIALSNDVVPGPPRSAILEAAENWGADLIVVGSHGHGVWGRFLLGSVSQSVVAHAKCSVEVVRCRSAEIVPAEELESAAGKEK